MQKTKGNPTAIVSISQAAAREDFKKGIFAKLSKNTDPFVEFLARIYSSNAHVISSVTNYGFDPAPRGNIDSFTPQWLGGDDTPLIEVGNCDQNGKRFDTSAYLRGDTSKEYISLYVMGKQIPVPVPRSGNLYTLESGTSASAAITSGLLSILVELGNDLGPPSSGRAKELLRDLAIDRKGTLGWPTAEEGYFVPRAATAWEIECEHEGEREEDPVIAAFVTNLPNTMQVTVTTMGFAEYTGSFAVRLSSGSPECDLPHTSALALMNRVMLTVAKPSCLAVTSRPTPKVTSRYFTPTLDGTTATGTKTAAAKKKAAETTAGEEATTSPETAAERTPAAEASAEQATELKATVSATSASSTPTTLATEGTPTPKASKSGAPSS